MDVPPPAISGDDPVAASPDRDPGVRAEVADGLTILRGPTSNGRKIVYVNSYGMALAWRLYRDGVYPRHHLWGCVELAARGYEVRLPEPPRVKGWRRRFRYDWRAAREAVGDLGRDDVVYCGHNVLAWVPLAKALRLTRAKIVGQLYAKEPLPLAGVYDGVIAHTPPAVGHARAIARKALVRHIRWGMDLAFFEPRDYRPEFTFSCGKAYRDFDVLKRALAGTATPATIVHADPASLGPFSDNVTLFNSRPHPNAMYPHLLRMFGRAGAVVVPIVPDPGGRRAPGVTNIFEAFASARPVIVTRTGATAEEIDVEARGVGLFVPPGDADALRDAIETLARDPDRAAEMGRAGRRLCEAELNTDRFADELETFFDDLV